MNLVDKYKAIYMIQDEEHMIVKVLETDQKGWSEDYVDEYFIIKKHPSNLEGSEINYYYMPDEKLRRERNMAGRPILKENQIEVITGSIDKKPWNWDDYINLIFGRR